MKRTAAIFFFLLCAAHAQARTLYVSLTGSHDTNAPAFSTWATAATNIQAAIDAASGGDTVRVAHGTYYSDNGTNDIISITNKSNLSVIGGNGTLFDADRTILDAGGTASVNPIYVNTASNLVAGFTAMNTKAEDAVLLYVSSVNCTLDSLIVRNNDMSGTTYGCGIKNIGGPGNEIRNCIVVGNGVGTASLCAGICNQRHLTGVGISRIANCVVEANTKQQLYKRDGTLTVANTIYGNVGGVIGFSGGNLTSNTTNSVMQALGIAPASEGVGTSLVWRGVSAYIPRIGSLARKNGVAYAGIETASDGAGGPALVTSRPFLGRDATTNLNHGAAIGGVTSAADSPFAGERSAAFDGASGYLDMGNVYNIGTNDLTLECWFKLNAIASDSTFAGKSYYGETSGRYAAFFYAPSTIYFLVQYGNTTKLVESIGWTPETGKWEHVAATWERDAGLTLYLNGASNAFTAAVNYDDLAISQPFLVGVYHTKVLYLNGSLSDVRIWNVARTPAEIQANYTNRLTGTEPGLVGYWPLKDPVISPIDTGPFNLDNPIIHPSYHEAF